ncbi:MAG: GldG family protein, partial [Proteobacteria bacterium]|nr:GldG family protein [Pseudomonadota bacterium]
MKQLFNWMASFKVLAAVLGIVGIVLSILVQFFLPELKDAVFHLLMLGAFLLLYYGLWSLRQIRDFLVGKRGRYGINSTLMILVFLAVVLTANYLGLLKHKRFDVTTSGRFTLAPQTINTVKNLKAPVDVLAFFPNQPHYRVEKQQAKYLLEEYRFFNRDFSFRFVDPETMPAEARKYNIRQNGTIVFASGSRQKPIAKISEQDFTGALLEVTGIKSKKVCFLAGHGERDLDGRGERGYSTAKMGLIRDLYRVGTIILTQSGSVSDDCALLVVAGATKSFPSQEREAVRDYLKRYGKLLLLTDPDPPDDVQTILSDWGLRIPEGRLLDGGAYAVPDKRTPAVYRGNYPPMIITRDLDTTYFPEAASIELTEEMTRVLEAGRVGGEKLPAWPLAPVQVDGLVVLPALLSTKLSWLERIGAASGDKSAPAATGENRA